MRTFFLLLLLANLGFFTYHHYLGEADETAAQIALLQINPEKISKVTALPAAPAAATPARALAPTPTPAPLSPVPAACVEWGMFAGAEVARAEAAFAALALPDAATQRRVSDGNGYWVHMPPLKTKAEADRKVGELKALGVNDFFVVQEAGPWRNAISLGLFKSEEAANAQLAVLRERGVRSAIVTRRENFLKQVSWLVREPDATVIARLTALQAEFPAAVLKAGSCPTELQKNK